MSSVTGNGDCEKRHEYDVASSQIAWAFTEQTDWGLKRCSDEYQRSLWISSGWWVTGLRTNCIRSSKPLQQKALHALCLCHFQVWIAGRDVSKLRKSLMCAGRLLTFNWVQHKTVPYHNSLYMTECLWLFTEAGAARETQTRKFILKNANSRGGWGPVQLLRSVADSQRDDIRWGLFPTGLMFQQHLPDMSGVIRYVSWPLRWAQERGSNEQCLFSRLKKAPVQRSQHLHSIKKKGMNVQDVNKTEDNNSEVTFDGNHRIRLTNYCLEYQVCSLESVQILIYLRSLRTLHKTVHRSCWSKQLKRWHEKPFSLIYRCCFALKSM